MRLGSSLAISLVCLPHSISYTLSFKQVSPNLVDCEDYRHKLTEFLASAWKFAKENVKGAQELQKRAHDKSSKDHTFKLGD